MEDKKGLDVEPVKEANCTRAVRMAPTLPGHKKPTTHQCLTSQDAHTRRQRESMQALIIYWGGPRAHKGHKKLYTKAPYGNQIKNP